ncbi:MAG TPA: hypothetical protein VM555_12905, partial [Tahibacter sp.]|nr:hypothetical protein [Tahibacter sp.]
MRLTTMKMSALGSAFAAMFLMPAAHAAVRFSDAIDGLYADAAHAGRGWVVDYIAKPNGDGILYLYGAAYDQTGKQVWVTTNFDVKEFEFKKTGVPMAMPTGGRFDDNWPGAVATTLIGTMDVELTSCGELKVALKPNAASGLPNSTQTLIASGDYVASAGIPTVNDRCVQKRKFTACPAGSTAVASAERTCQITGTIASNMTLTNETTWVLKGLVKVGTDNANKVALTIEPGTLITGSGQA